MAPPQSGSSTTDSRWNLEILVFMEGEKPENPEKNPRSKEEDQQQTQPHMTGNRESNPGHIGGRRALSPLRHPCYPWAIPTPHISYVYAGPQSPTFCPTHLLPYSFPVYACVKLHSLAKQRGTKTLGYVALLTLWHCNSHL